jgi:DNA-binding FrmR family transcriptional regulator
MAQDTKADAKTEREALLARLRRIEGQIRGIHRMVAEDRVCDDVLTQLMAARSGLDRVGLALIDEQIEKCLLASTDPEEGMRNLQSVLRSWLRFGAPTPTP